jgi:hypothetical protein
MGRQTTPLDLNLQELDFGVEIREPFLNITTNIGSV